MVGTPWRWELEAGDRPASSQGAERDGRMPAPSTLPPFYRVQGPGLEDGVAQF